DPRVVNAACSTCFFRVRTGPEALARPRRLRSATARLSPADAGHQAPPEEHTLNSRAYFYPIRANLSILILFTKYRCRSPRPTGSTGVTNRSFGTRSEAG